VAFLAWEWGVRGGICAGKWGLFWLIRGTFRAAGRRGGVFGVEMGGCGWRVCDFGDKWGIIWK
jgi:hypothetical protein